MAQTMSEQTADPAKTPSPIADLAENEAANPDEIVVIARRRAENILDVPISVSAFSEQQLINSGAYDLSGIQGAVPNLNIVQGRGSASSANITIRGIGQPDALQTFDPAVGVYVDGVYQSRIQGALFSMFDVQQVEVLRGPQGTLYGKNTIGGAINIISRKPGNDVVANASFAYGSYNQILANAYVAAPLVQDKLAVGIAGTYNKRDGTVTDVNTGEKYNDINTGTGRIIVRATPVETLEVLFSADYTRQDSSLTLGQNTTAICQLALGVPGLPQPPVNANCTPPNGFFGNRVIAKGGRQMGLQVRHRLPRRPRPADDQLGHVGHRQCRAVGHADPRFDHRLSRAEARILSSTSTQRRPRPATSRSSSIRTSSARNCS